MPNATQHADRHESHHVADDEHAGVGVDPIPAAWRATRRAWQIPV